MLFLPCHTKVTKKLNLFFNCIYVLKIPSILCHESFCSALSSKMYLSYNTLCLRYLRHYLKYTVYRTSRIAAHFYYFKGEKYIKTLFCTEFLSLCSKTIKAAYVDLNASRIFWNFGRPYHIETFILYVESQNGE